MIQNLKCKTLWIYLHLKNLCFEKSFKNILKIGYMIKEVSRMKKQTLNDFNQQNLREIGGEINLQDSIFLQAIVEFYRSL